MSIAQEIKQYCEEREIKFVGDYSGRFMYGKKCIGYIGRNDARSYRGI